MEAILGYVTTMAGTLFDVAGDTVTFVTANPLALLGVASMLVVTGIGVARSIIRGI